MLKRCIIWICLVVLACVCPGCEYIASPYGDRLARAEQRLEQAPDSVYTWLLTLEQAELSPPDRAIYLLLRTEAEDKLYVEHTTDSLIAIARVYFEKENDRPRLAKAWYLTGRIHSDWKQWDQAMQDFLKARTLTEDSEDYALRARIASFLGDVNWRNRLYMEARSYHNESLRHYRQARDTVGIASALRCVGETYMAKYQTDSAFYFYKQALSLAETTQDKRLLSGAHNSLGYMYTEDKQYDWALLHFRQAMRYAVDHSSVYKDIGALFIQMGQLDSARYYLEQVLQAPFLPVRCMANYYLGEVAHLEGNEAEAYRYKKMYEQLADSLNQEKQPEAVNQIQQQSRQQEMQEAHRIRLLKRDGLIAGLAALLLGGYVLWRRIRGQKPLPLPELPLEQSDALPASEPDPAPTEEIAVEPPPGTEERYKACLSQCEAHPILASLLSGRKTVVQHFTAKDWKQFAEAFDSVYTGFTDRLKEQCPGMTPREMQICQLSIMGIKVSRIADLIGSQSDSLSSSKQKIKAKYFKGKGRLEDHLLKFLVE